MKTQQLEQGNFIMEQILDTKRQIEYQNRLITEMQEANEKCELNRTIFHINYSSRTIDFNVPIEKLLQLMKIAVDDNKKKLKDLQKHLAEL